LCEVKLCGFVHFNVREKRKTRFIKWPFSNFFGPRAFPTYRYLEYPRLKEFGLYVGHYLE
jgi:hypothetical protein